MKYILTIFAMIISASSFADNYTSSGDGSWTNSATWNLAGYPDDNTDNATIDNGDEISFPGTGVKITISELILENNAIFNLPADDTLVCDSISVINNADVFIDGVLIVLGGIYMRENSYLNLNTTGTIEVGGNFYGENKVDLNIDGTMHVAGDFRLGNNSTIAGEGTIIVDGDVDVPGTVGEGILPVELLYFKGLASNGAVELSWSTASELNNSFFTIERSLNGYDFEEIASVDGAGTTSTTNNYSYTDEAPNQELLYYRLKQTDFDGQSETFNTIAVEMPKISQESIKSLYVANNEMIAKINAESAAEATVILTSINGKIIRKESLSLTQGISHYALNLSKGIYVMTLIIEGNSISEKFIF